MIKLLAATLSVAMSEAGVVAGDGGGVLHIMDLPRNLRRRVPSEVNTMQTFLMRQLARLDYLQACKPRRAQLLKVCVCLCLSTPPKGNPATRLASKHMPC